MLEQIKTLLITDLVKGVWAKTDDKEVRLYLLKVGLVEIEAQAKALAQLMSDPYQEKVILEIDNPFRKKD